MQVIHLIIPVLCSLITQVFALDLDVTDKDSICYAGALISDGIMDYYPPSKNTSGATIGVFQSPYYWWEAGEAWGGLIDYWFFCDNTTWEDLLYDALIAQRGDDYDYIPWNQSTTEGNDDQGFWGLAIMEAAERNFTNPPDDEPGWLAMTQAVFNTMWARWDTEYCGGGLRWQIFTWNSGYTYKNTISTACMFAIGARLGRYTGNDTYIDVANETFEWLVDIGFVVEDGDSYSVYDGAEIDDNCTDKTESQWTYNFGLLLAGSAYAYNYTEDDTWLTRVEGLLNGASVFFKNDIMYESTCQNTTSGCNNDERSFKSIFSRCLGQTAVLAPTTYDTIYNYIEKSATAAALSCSGGSDGHTCGQDWTINGYDGVYGVGEQMSSLEIIQNLLINQIDAPYTNETGGSSTGDASLGSGSSTRSALEEDTLDITTKDKAGSGVITAVVLAVLIGGSIWMVL